MGERREGEAPAAIIEAPNWPIFPGRSSTYGCWSVMPAGARKAQGTAELSAGKDERRRFVDWGTIAGRYSQAWLGTNTLVGVVWHPCAIPRLWAGTYLVFEQFWGRAARAPRFERIWTPVLIFLGKSSTLAIRFFPAS